MRRRATGFTTYWAPGWTTKIIPHETYVVQLSRVVLAAAKHGNAVFVGRGAKFLLPRRKGFRRPADRTEPFRIENLMRLHSLEEAEAKRSSCMKSIAAAKSSAAGSSVTT